MQGFWINATDVLFTTDQLLFSHIYNVELSKEDNRNSQIVILFQLSNLTDQPKADIHLSPKWNISTIILYMATWLSADIKIPVLLRGPPWDWTLQLPLALMWHISRLNKDWLWLGILITITIFYFILFFYFTVDIDIWRFEKSHISAVFPSERNRFVKCRHLWILTSLKIIVLLHIDLSQPTNSDQVSWLLFVPIQTQGSSTW